VNDLKDLYLNRIQDLYSSCAQSRDATIEMEKAAADPKLKEALHRGHGGISAGMDVMAGILRRHGEEPGGVHCTGMEGIVAEARKDALEAEIADASVRDAMIVAQYQFMAHYAIAGYGTIRAYAKRLGLDEEAELIGRHLDSTAGGDETMTALAEGRINPSAA
jgi:ferritin-like metal-binding protein YciE